MTRSSIGGSASRLIIKQASLSVTANDNQQQRQHIGGIASS